MVRSPAPPFRACSTRMVPTALMLAAFLTGMPVPALAQETQQKEPSPTEKVLTKPLRDTNLVKPKVAPLLERVMKEPYSTAGLTNCRRIAAAVSALNGVLGPDLDKPVPPGKEEERAELTAAAADAVVGSIIPGEALVRHLTGADKAQKHAAAAVFAGSVRRGFLKGLGKSKGCHPPAAPLAGG